MKVRCKNRASLKKLEGILDPKLIQILVNVLLVKAGDYLMNGQQVLTAVCVQAVKVQPVNQTTLVVIPVWGHYHKTFFLCCQSYQVL